MDFEKQIEGLGNDLHYQAEGHLLELTETICQLHGQYKGRYLVLYHLLEWVADKLIWRSKKDTKEM